MIEKKVLTDREARSVGDGRYAAGEELELRVRNGGTSRSYIVRFASRDYTIGTIKGWTIARARVRAAEILAELQAGLDPTEERRKAQDELRKAREAEENRKTFAQAADALVESRSSGWRVSFDGRSSTATQWAKDMAVDCKPFAGLCVESITIKDIKPILAPYWEKGHLDRARALLGRIEMVLDYAIAHDWRTADNAAAWKRWQYIFPRAQRTDDSHHAAIDWRKAPAMMTRLGSSTAVGARLVEFIILTAARSGEARGALWSEIDFDRRVWTVPGSRMKKGKEHSVPLSDQAIELLGRMERVGEFVFPGGRGKIAQSADKPMSNASLWALVQRSVGDEEATTHGFRSAFKDWANNQGVDHHLSERALAHDIGDATVTAYARDTLTEKRRPMMEAWGAFLGGELPRDNVVTLRRVA